jgi:large conductance mechanosensitive channel
LERIEPPCILLGVSAAAASAPFRRGRNGGYRPSQPVGLMLSEFRKFIERGSVVDLAVGIVIGAAFTTVVKSLVDDIVMPPIGKLTGGVNFSNLFITLGPEDYATLEDARKAGAATINYGLFLNNLVMFFIVAFAVFLIVKAYNRLQQEEAPVPEKDCPYCRMKIPVAATRCGHCTTDLGAART